MMYKKNIYIFLTILLVMLLALIVHGIVELIVINNDLHDGIILTNHSRWGGRYCVLTPWFSGTLWLGGLLGGYFLGQRWWQIVYVEHRHWRMNKRKSKGNRIVA